MPSFCRHNRLESTCPVCSRKRTQDELASRPARKPAARAASLRPARTTRSGAARRRGADVTVRRIARAVEDGFESDLVPGIRASADAALLAEELGFAAARLEILRSAPPGLLADAAALGRDGRREEALWLVAQIAAIGPREAWQTGDGDSQHGAGATSCAAIIAAAVPWAGDTLPDVPSDALGPRACPEPARTLAAYRAWAVRAGGQAPGLRGEDSWTAQRRFDRAFERLALPGFARGPRYEFLLLTGMLGLVDIEPASLHLLADPRDPVLAAAKRVFGFGDPIVLARRASELAAAVALPIAALDLGLLNWARRADDSAAGRITSGVDAVPDADVTALGAHALGLEVVGARPEAVTGPAAVPVAEAGSAPGRGPAAGPAPETG